MSAALDIPALTAMLFAALDIPALTAMLFGVLLLAVLIKWHVDETPFDIRHVLIDIETGRVSLHKFGQFLALFTSTGLLWYEAVNGRLSEWLFGGYMVAWAGVALGNSWLKNQKGSSSPDWEAGRSTERREAERRQMAAEDWEADSENAPQRRHSRNEED
jgi:hypothetical protein